MKARKPLLAAAIAAAVCLFGLLLWSWLGPDAEEARPPPTKTAQKSPPPAPRPTGDESGAMQAGPQVAMENDPVGPLVLEGQVLDGQDEPVGGALVRLSSNPSRTATSDRDGSFSFDKLVPRAYWLSARRGDEVGGPVMHTLRAASDPVIIRLARGASIDVTVVAAGAGTPIAGATVSLRGDDSLSATTDATGIARLRGVAASPFISVAARASGYALGQNILQVPDSPGTVVKTRIELRRGAEVSGVVVDDGGKPVAGARVWELDVSQLFELADEDDQATTDAKGRFTLPAIAAGTYRFQATHPRHAPGSSEPRAVDGTQPIAGVRIELGRGARLAGRVVDTGGAPVAWATVRVGPRESGSVMTSGFATRQAVADDKGAFELAGLPREAVRALATSEEASSQAVEVDLAGKAEVRDLVLRLDVAGRIEGVVVDAAGQPVAEARVTAYPDIFAGGKLEDLALRGPAVEGTDGDGRFAFRGLAAGDYRLQASRSAANPNPFSRRTVKAATGATGVRLVIEQDGGIRGRVQFDDGSAPPLFTVAVGFSPPLPVGGEDGAFELPGVAPGKHDLIVRGPDFSQATVRDVAVESGRVRDVGVIEVKRGRAVSGRVLGPSGAPVAGATVVLGQQIIGDGRALSTSALESFGDQMGLRQTKSDGQGRYLIGGIGVDRDLVIAAEHDSEGRSLPVAVPIGSDSPAIDLRLAGFGSVAGLVRAGDKPAQAQVIATSPAAARQNVVVVAGADGRYQIERLAAGDYKLTAMVGGGMGGTTASKRARVEAGKKVEVNIDVAVGDIALLVSVKPKGQGAIDFAQVFVFSGQVSVVDGKGVNEAMLAAGNDGGVKHQLGGTGSPLRFAEMSPGRYSICVLPITGDLQDPAFAQRLMEHPEKLKVYCAPHEVADTPKQQSYTASVPPMEPLQ